MIFRQGRPVRVSKNDWVRAPRFTPGVFKLKRSCLSLFSVSAVVLLAAPAAVSGQQTKHASSTFHGLEPDHPLDSTEVKMLINAQAETGSTLPVWNYSVVAGQNSNTYSGSIVGRSPLFHGHTSTTIQAYLVPVVLTFSDGTVFDPTSNNSCRGDNVLDLVENSPIFQSTKFDLNGVNIGTTQYVDAFQRASFWQYVAPSSTAVTPYHTIFGLNTLSAIDLTVPASEGFTHPPVLYGGCPFGAMDYIWFSDYVKNTLIPLLAGQGVGPGNLPVFIFDNVVMYPHGDASQCPPNCYLGDHGNYTASSGLLQTYVIADFDTTGQFDSDISVLSHEVAGWMNDPYNINPTPAWSSSTGGMPGQCGNLLEVGNPLNGAVFQVTMPNGFTYKPQELAFFSWFYNQSPSIGAGGLYSDQGTFTNDAGPACQ